MIADTVIAIVINCLSSRRIRQFIPVAFALAVLIWSNGASIAQDRAQLDQTTQPKPIVTAAGAIEALKSDEGTWEVMVTLWARPENAPIKSNAVVNAKLEVGGKFLELRFEGKFGPEMENQAWTSLSYTNFDQHVPRPKK